MRTFNIGKIKLIEMNKYLGYFAGTDGNIYSYWTTGVNSSIDYNKSPRILKGGLSGPGYLHVAVKTIEGKFISKDIHRLVCETFNGISNLTVSHKDGNKLNNKLSNLKYETHKENIRRKLLHGTDDRGYKNSRAKINKKQLKEIRRLLNLRELTHEQIAKKFNVNRTFITKINCGIRYKNI